MKCPNCDGRGTVEEPIYNQSHTLIKNWKTVQCDICGGSGEFNAFKEQTNEEWIRSCSTEELAELLTRISDNEWKYPVMPSRVDVWLEWLKQKHIQGDNE